MFRKTEDLKVGDWILTPSLVTSRFCGKPWQVDKISTSRVYISYRPGGDPTDIETKYIQRDRILLAFTTESEANEASDKARLLSDIYESDLRDLKKRHQEKVKTFIDLVSGADPRYAARSGISPNGQSPCSTSRIRTKKQHDAGRSQPHCDQFSV